MEKNEWIKSFTQSLMVALLLMVFAFFYTELQSAESKIRMGRSTLAEFKQTVKNQAEGDFAQKLKELSDKTSVGKNSGYWRLALKKQFNLSFDIGNRALHSGYYFMPDVDHSALDEEEKLSDAQRLEGEKARKAAEQRKKLIKELAVKDLAEKKELLVKKEKVEEAKAELKEEISKVLKKRAEKKAKRLFPVLVTKTEKILCLMIFETETRICKLVF